MEVTVSYLLMLQKNNGSQLKAKYSEIQPNIPSLGNISKDFKIDNMKKLVWKRVVKGFSIDYNAIDTNVRVSLASIYALLKSHKFEVWNLISLLVCVIQSRCIIIYFNANFCSKCNRLNWCLA